MPSRSRPWPAAFEASFGYRVTEGHDEVTGSSMAGDGISNETAVVFADERPVLTAVARTNVADPADVAGTLRPEVTRGMSPAERSRIEHYTATRGRELGRRFDTGSCEVASATAKRVGLGSGVERALREAVE